MSQKYPKNVDVFEKRKSKGAYTKSVPTTVAKVWDNLEKLFPTSAQIVKDNVSKKKMDSSVRYLLTGKQTDCVTLHSFSEERETRKGKN